MKAAVRCFASLVLRTTIYIIAVGGAGSLGSPALVSGKKTINAISPAITIIPPIK